jgi:hypothetical protein
LPALHAVPAPGAVRVDRSPRVVLFAYEPKHCSYGHAAEGFPNARIY